LLPSIGRLCIYQMRTVLHNLCKCGVAECGSEAEALPHQNLQSARVVGLSDLSDCFGARGKSVKCHTIVFFRMTLFTWVWEWSDRSDRSIQKPVLLFKGFHISRKF
jgi:hypothetical protein